MAERAVDSDRDAGPPMTAVNPWALPPVVQPQRRLWPRWPGTPLGWMIIATLLIAIGLAVAPHRLVANAGASQAQSLDDDDDEEDDLVAPPPRREFSI